MNTKTARIQTKRITNWNSFHAVFAQTMSFPDFYGRNMNAWIDCMSDLDDGMTRVALEKGELFHLEITDSKDFAKRLPEIYNALIECSACVNSRRVDVGEPPVLALILL